MTADDAPILDWKKALSQVDGDRQLLLSVTAAALEEIPARLTSLQAAIDSGDGKVIQREAHTIKGAVRIFGPTNVGSIAAKIEAVASASADVKELCKALEQGISQLLPVLEACEEHI